MQRNSPKSVPFNAKIGGIVVCCEGVAPNYYCRDFTGKQLQCCGGAGSLPPKTCFSSSFSCWYLHSNYDYIAKYTVKRLMLQPHRKVFSLHLYIQRKAGKGYCFSKLFRPESLFFGFLQQPIVKASESGKKRTFSGKVRRRYARIRIIPERGRRWRTRRRYPQSRCCPAPRPPEPDGRTG